MPPLTRDKWLHHVKLGLQRTAGSGRGMDRTRSNIYHLLFHFTLCRGRVGARTEHGHVTPCRDQVVPLTGHGQTCVIPKSCLP